MQSILIIEDERDIRDFLVDFLRDEGFVVEGAESGSKGLERIEVLEPDLVILDLGLPDIAGESVLTQIREAYPSIATIILTAKSKVKDIAEGLNLGADDYLTKPFAAEELLARINARLRKNHSDQDVLKMDDLNINLATYEVSRGEEKISLTKTEFDLLVYLMKNKDRVLTRDMILNRVWGYQSDVESRVVDTYISSLRKKIDAPFEKKLIHNQRGVGYMIKLEA